MPIIPEVSTPDTCTRETATTTAAGCGIWGIWGIWEREDQQKGSPEE